MKKNLIWCVLFLHGCATAVPAGYYQPHAYESESYLDESELAIIYGSCQQNTSYYPRRGETFTLSVDGNRVDAFKVYVKPGVRTLKISYYLLKDNGYFGKQEITHTFKSGHKYQIYSMFGDKSGGSFTGYKREAAVYIQDMGDAYTPTNDLYLDHDADDPLVIKERTTFIHPLDCRVGRWKELPATMTIKKEYKEILIKQGFEI